MDKVIQSEKHIFTQRILEKIDIGVIYTSMIASDKSIFVFGGDDDGYFTPSAEVRRYDIADQKWHKLKEMPHYLWGATAQIVGDKIFVMGGGRKSTCTSYNLVYNINEDSWEEKANMPISRKGLVSGVIDGIIYITGGYIMWGVYNVDPYCYAYNPKTDTWKECQSPISKRSYGMSVVIDNYLYVLGGYTCNRKDGRAVGMKRYCPKTNLWETMPSMLRHRRNAVAVAIDSKIFVLSGTCEDDYITIDYYDTVTEEWTISDIPQPAIESPGVAMIDNKIYLTAGKTMSGEFNKSLYEITYRDIRE